MENSRNTFNNIKILMLILRYKYFIIAMFFLSAAISTVIAFILPNWYSSTSSLVPPKTTSTSLQGALGSISSTLKDIGLTKLGSSGENIYSQMVILNSRTVKDSIIVRFNLSEIYDIPIKKMTKLREEFDDNLEINLEPEGNYTITIWDKNPDTAALMVKEFVRIANLTAQQIFRSEAKANRVHLEQRIFQTDSMLKNISDSLETYSRLKNIFSPEDQAKAISSALADLKAEKIKQEVVLELLQNRYGENDSYTMMQKGIVESLGKQLEDAKTKPGFAGNFALSNATEVGIEFLRLYAEFQTFSKVKSFLLPMLEESRLDEIRENRTLYVVDEALPADKKARPKRTLIILGSIFGSLIFSLLFILAIYGINNAKESIKQYNLQHPNDSA